MKLSLRELFLLVALVAMGCGWWVQQQEIAALKEIADKSEMFEQQVLSLATAIESDSYRIVMREANYKDTGEACWQTTLLRPDGTECQFPSSDQLMPEAPIYLGPIPTP